MDAAPRLLVFVGFFLVVLSLSLAFLQLILPPRPRPIANLRELEQCRSKLEEGEAASARVRQENERLLKELVQAHKEQQEARAAATNCQARADDLHQQLAYGAELLRVQPLTTDALSRLVMSLHELRPDLESMRDGSREVWAGLMFLAQGQTHNRALVPLVHRIEDTEHRRFESALNGFLNNLQNTYEPRPLLAKTYTTYREWRSQMLATEKMLGHPIYTVPGFVRWSTSEAKFFADLRKKVAIPELHGVGRAVAEYEREYGLVEPLTPT
jgi:hypothetical protein